MAHMDLDIQINAIMYALWELLGTENSGHDAAHSMRVYRTAMCFCNAIPAANRDIVAMIALLHDCDERKVFGTIAANELPHAKEIMRRAGVSDDVARCVCANIRTISFNKRMSGIMPASLEGEIVADADMCDAIGASGIARCIQYGAAKGIPFFDPNVLPADLSGDKYAQFGATSFGVNHFFEKLLRIRDYCLTVPGRAAAANRHKIMVDFLDQYFTENNAPEQWRMMLDKYRTR